MTDAECAFDSCDRPGETTLGKAGNEKYCKVHYSQWWRGKEMTPIRAYGPRRQDPEGLRVCSTCDEAKPVDEFYTRANGQLMRQCKTCVIKANRAATLRRQARDVA